MFLTALTVVALGANSAIPAAVREQFAQWKAKHGVKYASPQEEDVRLANFHSNLVTIAHLNAASANATAGARFGANKFADRSAKELAGLRGFHGHVAMAMRRNATNVAARLPTDATPDSYDWRSQRGIIAPVQDQGQCGSCWAFSATANLESRYAIATKTPVNKLAEQLLVDCEHNCGTFRDMNGCDAGCNGGLMPNAFVYAMANGDAIESSYPYTGADGTCQSFSRVGRWTGWEFVPEDEDQIAAYLAANGPVSVAVDASMWSFYLGGIMQSWFICGNPLAPDSSLDHGVMLVGFGEEGGVKYWIVRNSWAASWGEEGYARILRGAGYCGVNLFACSSKV